VSRPTFTIVAGANGAGKSTLTSGNLDIFGGVPLLDPDAFATTIRATGTGLAAISAGKEVLRVNGGT
jgi:predicted ABC-type ATPase